jgi:hypothetical protein
MHSRSVWYYWPAPPEGVPSIIAKEEHRCSHVFRT